MTEHERDLICQLIDIPVSLGLKPTPDLERYPYFGRRTWLWVQSTKPDYLAITREVVRAF